METPFRLGKVTAFTGQNLPQPKCAGCDRQWFRGDEFAPAFDPRSHVTHLIHPGCTKALMASITMELIKGLPIDIYERSDALDNLHWAQGRTKNLITAQLILAPLMGQVITAYANPLVVSVGKDWVEFWAEYGVYA